MNATRVLFLLSLSLLSLTLQAEIYSWVDEQGNRIYSDQKPGSEHNSTTVNSSGSVNYYQPQTRDKNTADNKPAEVKETISVQSTQTSARDEAQDDGVMTEEKCQEIYGLSCDRVFNWKTYALEKCGSDDRCEDAGFLERKYKPLAIAELQRRANLAGARRNSQEKKLIKFLRNKYSDQCDNQVKAYCRRKPNSKACDAVMIQVCEDDRSLEEMLARYDDLTPIQKQRVLALADELEPSIDWQQATRLLGDIVELIALGAGV